MKYDFTKIIDRHGKDAIAIDGLGQQPGFTPDPPKEGFDVIPMWVADMNFETVPTNYTGNHRKSRASCFWIFFTNKRILFFYYKLA